MLHPRHLHKAGNLPPGSCIDLAQGVDADFAVSSQFVGLASRCFIAVVHQGAFV